VKANLLIRLSYREPLEMLTDEERGKLLIALMDYAENGIVPELNSTSAMAFAFIKIKLDEDLKKYEDTVRRNQENGKKGGRPKNPVGSDKTQETQWDNQKPKKPNSNSNYNNNLKKNNKNIVQEAQDLFERLWEIYPLKRGKGQVSDANKRRLLDIGYEQLAKAVERYKADLAKEDWRKPQNGSTFFNSGYKDYLDCNYVSPPEEKKGVRKSTPQNFEQRNYGTELDRQLFKN